MTSFKFRGISWCPEPENVIFHVDLFRMLPHNFPRHSGNPMSLTLIDSMLRSGDLFYIYGDLLRLRARISVSFLHEHVMNVF